LGAGGLILFRRRFVMRRDVMRCDAFKQLARQLKRRQTI
jgi:hypothetical protein